MGAIKTMKEVEGALPKKKDAQYIRILDSEGNPSLISKVDLAYALGVSGGSIPLTLEVNIDFTNPSPEVERIGTPDFPNWLENSIQGIMVKDGAVNYQLDRKTSLQKATGGAAVIDGTDGDICMDWVRFWTKITPNAKGLNIRYSNTPKLGDGWVESPQIWVGATEMVIRTHDGKQTAHSCYNMSAEYRGGNGANWDGQPKSLLGKPKTQIPHDAMRTACRNKGTFASGCYHNFNYQAFVKMNLMFMAIFGTRDWQADFAGIDPLTGFPKRDSKGFRYGGLGRGVTTANYDWWNTFNGLNPFIPTNAGLELGCGSGVADYVLNTGSETKQFRVPVFCGVVNPFGHIWKAIDGLTKTIELSRSTKKDVWGIFADPEKYVSSGVESAAKVVRIDTLPDENYLKEVDSNFLPVKVGGTESENFCDRYYMNANPGNYSVWLGGGASYGGQAGGWSVNSNNGVGNANANYGGRLYFAEN